MKLKNGLKFTVLCLSLLVSVGCATQGDELPDEDLDKAPRHKKVVLYGYEFKPDKLKLAEGNKVTFENKDPASHNVTIPALGIDRELKAGKSFTYTFDTIGEFAVSDESIDKPMRMTITVE